MTSLLALLLACAGSHKPDPESAAHAEAPPEAPADVATPQPERVVKRPSPSRAAVNADYGKRATDFAMRFHQQIADGNTATSGISAEIALSMLAAGARGQTQAEFETLFGAPVDEAWHIDNARALAAYNDTLGAELTVTNGLWTDTGFSLLESYSQLLTDDYRVQPAQLDFSDANTAAATINRWTQEHTKGMIEKLFEPPDVQGAKVVLANAVAFKGKWAVPFDLANTKPMPFHVGSESVDVPTMNATLEHLSYVDEEGFSAVAIPYQERATQMIIVLPDEGVELESVEARLDAQMLGRTTMSGRRPVNIALPKWQAEYSYDLLEPLAEMGLSTAFRGGDYSGMSEQALTLDAAIQKVVVKVDEEGTEAAAVTGIIMKTTSTAVAPPPVDFVVDRPFFWVIWHTETRSPLFTGRVVDPR